MTHHKGLLAGWLIMVATLGGCATPRIVCHIDYTLPSNGGDWPAQGFVAVKARTRVGVTLPLPPGMTELQATRDGELELLIEAQLSQCLRRHQIKVIDYEVWQRAVLDYSEYQAGRQDFQTVFDREWVKQASQVHVLVATVDVGFHHEQHAMSTATPAPASSPQSSAISHSRLQAVAAWRITLTDAAEFGGTDVAQGEFQLEVTNNTVPVEVRSTIPLDTAYAENQQYLCAAWAAAMAEKFEASFTGTQVTLEIPVAPVDRAVTGLLLAGAWQAAREIIYQNLNTSDLKPENRGAWLHNLAIVQTALGQWQTAQQSFQTAHVLAANPDSLHALQLLQQIPVKP